MDDSELIAQARTDSEAFAELYRRHVTRVYRYHMAHTGDVKDAEDLTSQTFMAALESLGSYRMRGSFAAWVMGIAVRKRAAHFRSRRAVSPLDEVAEVLDVSQATDKTAIQQMQLSEIRCAIQQLSSDRADAITLCFFAGLDYGEAARALGKSEAAVKMLVSRGLNDLRTRTSLSLEAQDE